MSWLSRQSERLRKLCRLTATGNIGELAHALQARRRNLDLEYASVKELGLPSHRAHFHSSSGGYECARVLKRVEIPAGSVVLDLGSGKGGAAITLSRFPFSEILGVELSPELVRIAEENVRRLGLRNVSFVHADAGDYTDIDRVTHLYMYNPFPLVVMERVLDNIRASLLARDRELTIVYKNPVFGDSILATGLFRLEFALKPSDQWWHVYGHSPRAAR